MKTMILNGTWNGRCIFPDGSDFSFEGAIPGSAINDLIRADRLPMDIFWRDNADKVLPFEACDYIYEKNFNFAEECKSAMLRFERLDTYADVFLNGIKIYHSENGNIRHDIDVTDSIRQGNNTIKIRLYSPSEWVKDKPLREGAFTRDRMNTRRMQCTYGWDWVARFLTCGIGECSLMLSEELEIFSENVYITTLDVDSESATVRADITFPCAYEGRVFEFVIYADDGTVACRLSKYCKESFVRLDFDIPNPSLWYPIGYGAQPLYTFEIKDNGRSVCRERFGIRTVKIMQLPDRKGSENYALALSVKNEKYDHNDDFSGFILKINGEKVFCQGANWVPCVPFACGDVRERQTELLELCAAAGVNMLRVWGGGGFESRHFYDECSRLGIMVTQDFLMACGDYPEEEDWFIKELQCEAEYAVRLCRNQACLVWWTGDNENAVKGSDTAENYRGRRSAYEGIAPVLYREDPQRRFLPSSPFGGNFYASNTVGTTHNTQFLSRFFAYLSKEDLSDYKEELKKYRARFIAEEPQLGAASLFSLRRFMSDEDIFEGEEMWRYHTKSNPALKTGLYDYLLDMTQKILGNFTSPKDKLFKLQYMQYEWIRVVMEQAKRERAFCSGILFWMMNDCWPAAAGWSLIDFYNIPKNAFYAFKRCAKPVVTSIDCVDGTYRVYAVNDGSASEEVSIALRILSDGGKNVKELAVLNVTLEKYSSQVVFEGQGLLQGTEVLICDAEGRFGRDRAFYRHGGLKMVPADVECAVDEKNHVIRVSAKGAYVHAVMVSGDILLEENSFSLLPNEMRTVSYQPRGNGAENAPLIEAYTLT